MPATVHDYLYYMNRIGKGLCTRKEADQMLYEGAEDKEQEYNVPWYRRRKAALYAAVRSWGWLPGLWGKKK